MKKPISAALCAAAVALVVGGFLTAYSAEAPVPAIETKRVEPGTPTGPGETLEASGPLASGPVGPGTVASGSAEQAKPVEPTRILVFTRTGSAGKVSFNHDFHIRNGKCESCHAGNPPLFSDKKRSETQFLMKDMYAGGSCGACHDGKKSFDAVSGCKKCHE